MLCRIFHSQCVQPARTLQLSYRTAQGSGTETGFTEAGCARWCSLYVVRICLCAHVGAPVWECLFVLVFAVFPRMRMCVFSEWRCGAAAGQTCFGTGTGCSQTALLPKDGTSQSQLMMCERRGEQIRTAIPQHELMLDAHVHTHTHTHTCVDTPRLTGPGLSPVKRSDCQLMFIPQQSHLSSAATYYCHPWIYTAELKGSPAWRLGEDSSGFCVSLTSELTT